MWHLVNPTQPIRFMIGLIAVLAMPYVSTGKQPGDAFQAGKEQKVSKPNQTIESKWGNTVQGFSLRVHNRTKSRWGIAESPTFTIQLRNNSEQVKEITVTSENLVLMINDRQYTWNAPGTRLISRVNGGETRDSFFILRMEPSQWKTVVSGKEMPPEKLEILDVGAKEFEVKLRLEKNNNEPEWVSTGKIKFEISKSLFELPTVGGILIDQNGEPVPAADVYLCKDAQFSIYYSAYDGEWFKSKNVSHYDPSGGFSSLIKPVKTNKKGEFLLSPGSRDKRLVVIPANGSAQVFDLPQSFRDWKVKLEPTGALVIEHDIEGENSTTNASISSTRALAVNPKNPNHVFMLTESFNIPLTNGKKYEFNNLAPNRFHMNRYKYIRMGKRTYSIGRMNRSFQVQAGTTTEYRMVRKTGQKISFTATKVPNNMQYLFAGVFALDEPINTNSVYSNETLWAGATDKHSKQITLESSLISPGKYRLVVMSVPQSGKPNVHTYKPDYIGSKIVEVKDKGILDTGPIPVYPVKTWKQNSGMALDIKLVSEDGSATANRNIWPVNKGYQQSFASTPLRSNVSGNVSAVWAAGKYSLVTGLESNQPTFFDVQVPRMTSQTVILSNKPEWETNEAMKLDLQLTATYSNSPGNTLLIEVHNTGKTEYVPGFGEFQIFLQSNFQNKNSGIRCFPDQDSPLYRTVFKPGEKTRIELDWNQLAKDGIWTSANLLAVKMNKMNAVPAKNRIGGRIKLGPATSAYFEVPELPILKPKPFR